MSHQDLRFALACLLRLRDMNKQENSDEIIREALWNAAIIRFFSVFDGPNALKLDILKELPERAQEAYDFFNTYRNKHVAHKVNPIDQIKAGVILSDPSIGVKKIEGIGNLSMNDASYDDAEFVDSLGRLTDALLKQVEKEIKTWSDRFLQEAKVQPIDDLYKLPALRVVVPNSDHLHRRRT